MFLSVLELKTPFSVKRGFQKFTRCHAFLLPSSICCKTPSCGSKLRVFISNAVCVNCGRAQLRNTDERCDCRVRLRNTPPSPRLPAIILPRTVGNVMQGVGNTIKIVFVCLTVKLYLTIPAEGCNPQSYTIPSIHHTSFFIPVQSRGGEETNGKG